MPSERFAVHSKDGVPISVKKSGSGPALLLVHGAGLDASTTWSLVSPALGRHFTLYAMNRRGRAPSGDGAQYSLEAEAGDLAAVAEAIGEAFTLLGHSYGAIVTLTAMGQLRNPSRLILYEPPVFEKPRGAEYAHVTQEMERALTAGQHEEIAVLFFRDQVGTPPEALAAMRSSPVWAKFVEVAPTLPRESRVVNTLRISPAQLGQMKVPATMLIGEISPERLREGALFVCGSIPACRSVLLEGQGHGAMLSAPGLFMSKILEITDQAAGTAD